MPKVSRVASMVEAKHLGSVKPAGKDAFWKALGKYIVGKQDSECFDFGVYNALQKSQSPHPGGLAANIDFLRMLAEVFPSGRALPTYLQVSFETAVSKAQPRNLLGNNKELDMKLWFCKRVQCFLHHLRRIHRHGLTPFQQDKLSQQQADEILAVARSLRDVGPEANEAEQGEDDEVSSSAILGALADEADEELSQGQHALLLQSLLAEPADARPAKRPRTRKAKAAAEKPVVDRRSEVLQMAKAAAEKPVAAGSLRVARKPAASNTTTKDLPGLGKTKASHFTKCSYIQHLVDDHWKCLCYCGTENRRSIVDEIWAWMVSLKKPITADMVHAKKMALLKKGDEHLDEDGPP